MKTIPFETFSDWILKQPPSTPVNMNESTPTSPCGCLMIQYARQHNINCTSVGCQYFVDTDTRLDDKAADLIRRCVFTKPTTFAEVHPLIQLPSCPAPTPPLLHPATSADPTPSMSSAPSHPTTPTTPTSPTAPDVPPATSQPTGPTNPSTAHPISAVKLDPDFLSDEVYCALLDQITIPPGLSAYTAISHLTPTEAFDLYLHDLGIINYTHSILSALNSINSAATQP